MTITDKLLAEGLTCPCGGRVDIVEFKIQHEIVPICAECGGGFAVAFNENHTLELLAAWLVLTGGPVPGSVKPPNNMWRRDLKANYVGPEWAYGSYFEDEVEMYMLTAGERTVPIITEWLQREVGE